MIRTIPLNGKNYTLRVARHDGDGVDGMRATVSGPEGLLFGDTLPNYTSPRAAVAWALDILKSVTA